MPLLDDPVEPPSSAFSPPPSSVELPHAVPSAITKDATMIMRRLFIENSSTEGNRGLQMRDAEQIFRQSLGKSRQTVVLRLC
jgi:hypothetical protein